MPSRQTTTGSAAMTSDHKDSLTRSSLKDYCVQI